MTILGFRGVHPLTLGFIPLALALAGSGFWVLRRFSSRLSASLAGRLARGYGAAFLLWAAACLATYLWVAARPEYFLIFYGLALAVVTALNAVTALAVLAPGGSETPAPPLPSRRRFVAGSVFLAAGTLVTLAGGNAATGEGAVLSRRVDVRRSPRALPGRPLRVSLVSDLHAGFFLPPDHLRQALDHVRAFAPDVVLFAGDLVENELSALDETGRFLTALAGLASCYAVLGNHDGYRDPDVVAAYHRSRGLTVLRGECAALDGPWGRFTLAGTRDLRDPDFSLDCLDQAPDLESTLLVTHNPDATLAIPEARTPWLALCGHTHGGQWRAPGIGALVNQADRRFEPRLNLVAGRRVLVTPGIGYSGLPVRLGCPPEVTNLVVA